MKELPLACRTCGVEWEPSATVEDRALLCERIVTCPAKQKTDWDSIPPHPITGNC